MVVDERPERLRKLADWLDLRHGKEEYDSDEVQQDLRKLAETIEANELLLKACRQIIWKLSHNWDDGLGPIQRLSEDAPVTE